MVQHIDLGPLGGQAVSKFDLIAFLLQGLPSNGTLTAVMAFMVDEFYKPDAVMDFPKGGSGLVGLGLAVGLMIQARSMRASGVAGKSYT